MHVELLLNQTYVLSYYLPRRSFSGRMTRFNDLVVVVYDIGAYSLTLGSWLWIMKRLTHPLLNRDPQVLLTYHKWPLHVDVDPLSRFPARTSTPRWEYYLTALDFELDVIRGRRPYRWTIWVGNYRRCSRIPETICPITSEGGTHLDIVLDE